jgi:hypothetical protein
MTGTVVFYAFVSVLSIGALAEWKDSIKERTRDKGRRRGKHWNQRRLTASLSMPALSEGKKIPKQAKFDFSGL